MKISSLVLLLSMWVGTAFGADRVNINEADAAALAQLSGIGPAKAEAIVAYRKANGPFRTVDDLAKVKGIGPAFIAHNRDQLTVGETKEPRRSANSQ